MVKTIEELISKMRNEKKNAAIIRLKTGEIAEAGRKYRDAYEAKNTERMCEATDDSLVAQGCIRGYLWALEDTEYITEEEHKALMEDLERIWNGE